MNTNARADSNPLRHAFAATVAWLADSWPDPRADKRLRYDAEPGTPKFERAYTVDQFMKHVWFGSALGRSMPDLLGKEVLEIGCGHGGISCYLASIGARKVVGIDLAADHFGYGQELSAKISQASGRELPLEFLVGDARDLCFAEHSFDAVVADNLFEHVTDPEVLMRECFRVLRPGGHLVVPTFSSIMSKYGLHLKNGLRLPWLNLVLDEQTIVEALQIRVRRRPELKRIYPNVDSHPRRVRDVRRHGDLNDITHGQFLELAGRVGFEVEMFRVHGTRLGRLITRLQPRFERTKLLDVLSTGAGALLRKPGTPDQRS
jgi:ubiquinone/menaquinone biosynthesis C-methylase UbiE